MGIIGIVTHIGVIAEFLSSARDYVAKTVADKALPVASDPSVRRLFDATEDLFKSGVIDIPGIDDEAIAEALQKIEDEVCK